VQIRRAIQSDISSMVSLERESPSAAHWSQRQYEDLFAATFSQPASERFAWVVEDDSKVWAARASAEDPQFLAFLIARRVGTEWELENIVVAPYAQRKGLGKLLLSELSAHVRTTCGSAIFLEVRESNRNARALYEKFGFEKTGLRKNYYVGPREDAALYRLIVG
jgi:ribosomal-protein-alanine acetyltransferase